MDLFLKNIKSSDISQKDAYEEIIVKLMDKKLKGEEKTDGFLTVYDSEPLFNGKPCIGNVYIFNYTANKPVKYEYNGQTAYYIDNCPIVLLTKITQSYIRGINFNLCNKGLKTIILNTIQNIDEDFYNGGDIELFNKGNLVFSKKVYEVLSDPNAELQLIHRLKQFYDKADYNMLFRNYSLSNISQFRLVENWQWEYIPFLNYYGSLKKDTLEAIQKISGINNIVI